MSSHASDAEIEGARRGSPMSACGRRWQANEQSSYFRAERSTKEWDE
jgi:hypothetical protein